MPLLSEEELSRSPRWFPLRFESPESLLMVDLDEEAYGRASFLDERLLREDPPQASCDLRIIAAAALRLTPGAFYIFHIGHVGSTLISRLIGAHESLFSVREPALLRRFSEPTSGPTATGTLDLQCCLALFARTWRPQQRAVIKVTSIVNEAAEAILGNIPRPAAIFVYASPLNYLRGILAGPNSRVESRVLAPGRMRRLEQRLGAGANLDAHSEGELVAMNWLSEMTSLHQTAARFPSQVLWVDFDAFLLDPATGLHCIFSWLGAGGSIADIEALLAGPMMRQYSKAPEYHYDANLRLEVLKSADAQHGAEIKRGLKWLARTASRFPLANAVLTGASRSAVASDPRTTAGRKPAARPLT